MTSLKPFQVKLILDRCLSDMQSLHPISAYIYTIYSRIKLFKPVLNRGNMTCFGITRTHCRTSRDG